MRALPSSLTLLLVISTALGAPPCRYPPTGTADTVDLDKLMGDWVEGFNSPRSTDEICRIHRFEGLVRGAEESTFTSFRMFKKGSEFSPNISHENITTVFSKSKDSMLQVRIADAPGTETSLIYKVGPATKDKFGEVRYEYIVVSNEAKYPVVVLISDLHSFKQKHEEDVRQWLEDNGFITDDVRARNLIQPVTRQHYFNCYMLTVLANSRKSS